MDSLPDSHIAQLYENVKPIIWIIQVDGTINNRACRKRATGFSVSHDGLIMTCAHTFYNIKCDKIKVRRLDENVFRTASLKRCRQSFDVAMLKLDKLTGSNFGKLARDGSLSEGQPLIHIGHPLNLVGSCLIGRVCFPCVEDVILPVSNQICETYKTSIMNETPRYRTMGHVWNAKYFELVQDDVDTEFSKKCHPLTPTIQCNGMRIQSGCSGGPVFNTDGEIVGMMTEDCDGFAISVHVTVLREFLKEIVEAAGSSKPARAEGISKKRHHD